MPKKPIDYSKTVIYKIQHNEKEDLIYVGHSTNFVERKKQHKRVTNTSQVKVYQMIRDNGGWDNFSCVIVHNFPCSTFEEARTEEDKVMRYLKANMNSINAIFDIEIYKPIKNAKNLKFMKEDYMKRDGYVENKKEYDKMYRKKNEAKIKETIKCSCGGKYQRKSKYLHDMSIRHIAFINSE